jgi:hypothetical protein
MFRGTCLVALGKRVVNLQIHDPGSPHRLGLEIPWTIVALKQDHLIMGTQSIKMQQTYIMNAWSERESDFENFGKRITEFEVTVAKIWNFEVSDYFCGLFRG